MNRRYVTVDVFTKRAFGGNQLAVVLEKRDGAVTAVHIGGHAVQVMSGLIDLPENNRGQLC